MFTSCGYHTFMLSKNLTQNSAMYLLADFKRYRDKTGDIFIKRNDKYKKDTQGRHFEIMNLKKYNGISWIMRFSNTGFVWEDGEIKPCSIKAVINPKILVGQKSYIEAANVSYLREVEKRFEQEAGKISFILKGFYNYSLSRVDYCINFDVSELKFNCPLKWSTKIPELIMYLIRCGDIPARYKEEYEGDCEFYLKSGASVINCYWKYIDLYKNFPECPDLKKSYNIIRFEVQCKYPKVHAALKEFRKEVRKQKEIQVNELKKRECVYLPEHLDEGDNEILQRFFRSCRKDEKIWQRDEISVMEMMLSDKECDSVIETYFNKVIGKGDYYTFDAARRKIEASVSRWEKVVRLTRVLEKVSTYRGVYKIKNQLSGKELDDFRRSVRELAELKINPVTIPEEWGIEYIPNLLGNYRSLCQKEHIGALTDQKDDGIYFI